MNFVIRWLRGGTRLALCGSSPEKLLRLIQKRRINLWQAYINGQTLVLNMQNKNSKEVCNLAQGMGLEILKCKSYGLPVLLKKYKNRVGFFVGVSIILILPFILSQFVLNITVEGNTNVESISIVRALEKMGLKKFTLAASHDTRSMERKLLLEIKELSFASVTVRGATIEVKVREGTATTEVLDTTTPSNIVANMDAKILETRVFEGHRQIKAGDSVQKGDLLVSGIMEDGSGKNRLVRSRAEIIAETKRELSTTIPIAQTTYTQTQTTVVKKIFFGNVQIFSSGNSPSTDAKLIKKAQKITILGKDTPAFIINEIYISRISSTQNIDVETAKKQVLSNVEKYVYENKIYSVKNTDFNVTEANGNYIFDTTLTCIENIANEVKILN